MASTIINPRGVHSHTIIFIHGRGSTAAEFSEEFFESQASDDRTFPEIFPTSKMSLSARFESEMSQWFDIWSVEKPEDRQKIQVQGLTESVASIISIIETEAALLSRERIILGGISQGCATAIHALFSGSIQLGGFIGLCSWLPFGAEVNNMVDDDAAPFQTIARLQKLFNPVEDSQSLPDLSKLAPHPECALATPVFLSHSEDDNVVAVKNGKNLHRSLKRLGMDVTWRAYEYGGHWVNEPGGVDDMVAFLEMIAQGELSSGDEESG